MFSLMNDMSEKKIKKEKRERERDGEIERKVKMFKERTEEAACSETAIKFSIGSLCPKFIHLSMHL